MTVIDSLETQKLFGKAFVRTLVETVESFVENSRSRTVFSSFPESDRLRES
jgi:hypothetical protein